MKQPKSFYESYRSVRRDWGSVNPTTRVFKDKTKYSRKEKHKKDFRNFE